MNLFLYVRQKLGITRETMAALLGTKPGLYNMAEINRRNLSPDAMDRLIWLWQTLQAFPDPETTAFSKTDLDLLLHKTRKKKKDIDQALQASETKKGTNAPPAFAATALPSKMASRKPSLREPNASRNDLRCPVFFAIQRC
jgi:hypothetical protein